MFREIEAQTTTSSRVLLSGRERRPEPKQFQHLEQKGGPQGDQQDGRGFA